jgi:hypothetical protein
MSNKKPRLLNEGGVAAMKLNPAASCFPLAAQAFQPVNLA